MKSKDHDTSDLHNHSYIDQSGCNRHRHRGCVWNARRQSPRRLDEVVLNHGRRDDDHRVLFSVSWFQARDRSWHHIATFFSTNHIYTITTTIRRSVAYTLCDRYL